MIYIIRDMLSWLLNKSFFPIFWIAQQSRTVECTRRSNGWSIQSGSQESRLQRYRLRGVDWPGQGLQCRWRLSVFTWQTQRYSVPQCTDYATILWTIPQLWVCCCLLLVACCWFLRASFSCVNDWIGLIHSFIRQFIRSFAFHSSIHSSIQWICFLSD
jgi:hypothetical protein